jgi:prepilin signal peptidase PulO-like enzyme (type II secretory pathway)
VAAEPIIAKNPALVGNQGAFENEIPTYRALSPLALFSTGCGLLSVLCFVSPNWLVVAVAAVVLGIFADFRIRKVPDLLTGRSFAHAGIAMGLMFGATSLTYGYWSTYILHRESLAFAKEFTKTLNTIKTKPVPDTSDVMWYMLEPSYRSGVSPEEARERIAKMVGPEGSAVVANIEMQIRQMAKFAGPTKPIEIVAIEDSSFQDGTGTATILLHLSDGQSAGHDHAVDKAEAKEQMGIHSREMGIIGEGADNALVVLRGLSAPGGYRFFVEQVRYPYLPKSFKPAPLKPKVEDDGHGHAH